MQECCSCGSVRGRWVTNVPTRHISDNRRTYQECQAPLGELGKTLDRHFFVGVHLKDFVQLSDLHHVMYVFRRIQ